MVKAMAEARIEITGGPDGSFIANLAAKCKQEVNVDVTKKLKSLSIRRFFFSSKGKRKDKDAPLITQDDSKRYLEEDSSREKVIDPDWERLVRLPLHTDKNEWLATHTISFFDHINMLYGSVSEYCTATECTTMSAPCNVQYQWVDEKGKKYKCAAPQYIEYVMTFIKKTLHDESVFPTKYGNDFPPQFDQLIKKIHRLLFHVLAHMYQAHYKESVILSIHPHLNTLFEHFTTFSIEFNLVEEKESEILDDLYQKLHLSGANMNTCLQKSHSSSPVSTLDSNRMSEGGERLSGGDVHVSAVRPTSLGCVQEHKQRPSANGSCHSHPDDDKENVCDSSNSATQSQPPGLSPMATPMST